MLKSSYIKRIIKLMQIPKERILRPSGNPDPSKMQQIFYEFYGFWFDIKVLPGVEFGGVYTGRTIELIMSSLNYFNDKRNIMVSVIEHERQHKIQMQEKRMSAITNTSTLDAARICPNEAEAYALSILCEFMGEPCQQEEYYIERLQMLEENLTDEFVKVNTNVGKMLVGCQFNMPLILNWVYVFLNMKD